MLFSKDKKSRLSVAQMFLQPSVDTTPPFKRVYLIAEEIEIHPGHALKLVGEEDKMCGLVI